MPHQETLFIMKQMDELRAQWGVAYPFETTEILTGEVEDTIPQNTDLQA